MDRKEYNNKALNERLKNAEPIPSALEPDLQPSPFCVEVIPALTDGASVCRADGPQE